MNEKQETIFDAMGLDEAKTEAMIKNAIESLNNEDRLSDAIMNALRSVRRDTFGCADDISEHEKTLAVVMFTTGRQMEDVILKAKVRQPLELIMMLQMSGCPEDKVIDACMHLLSAIAGGPPEGGECGCGHCDSDE